MIIICSIDIFGDCDEPVPYKFSMDFGFLFSLSWRNLTIVFLVGDFHHFFSDTTLGPLILIFGNFFRAAVGLIM